MVCMYVDTCVHISSATPLPRNLSLHVPRSISGMLHAMRLNSAMQFAAYFLLRSQMLEQGGGGPRGAQKGKNTPCIRRRFVRAILDTHIRTIPSQT